MYLTNTTETLQVILAGAVTTNHSVVTVDYGENTATTFVAGKQRSTTNGTTAVNILNAPASANTQRIVELLTMTNQDTAPITVTIRTNDGGTLGTQFGPVTLQVGERIQFATDTGFTVYTVTGAVKVTAVQSTVEPGYIDGLIMQWDSATQMTVSSGTCYIPSVGANVNFASALTKTPTLSASTFYHVYAFLNSGVPDIEIVTTAPSSPYNGVARTKTGDTTRRYIGSVLTNASSQLYRFVQSNDEIHYLTTIGSGTPFRILSAGAATTLTSVSASSVVPVSSVRAEFQFINGSAGSQFMLISPPDVSADVVSVAAGARFLTYFPLISGAVGYYMTAVSGSAFIDVHGYSYQR